MVFLKISQICEVFKITHFEKHLRPTASGYFTGSPPLYSFPTVYLFNVSNHSVVFVLSPFHMVSKFLIIYNLKIIDYQEYYNWHLARHWCTIMGSLWRDIAEIIRPVTYVSVRLEAINVIIRTIIMNIIGNRRQISLLTLSELINFCSTWNYEKPISFLMISGAIEVN